MIDELIKIILLLSVGQGLTLSLLLLFKNKGDIIANRILSALILLMIIPLWNEYISTLSNSFSLLIFSPQVFYFQLLYGPLIYLYTMRYTKSSDLPIVTYALLLAGPIFGSLFKSSHFYLVEGGFSQFIWYLFFVTVIAQIAICLFASWLRLQQHDQDIKQNLSNLEKSKLDWLKLLIYGYTLLLAIDFVLVSSKILSLPILDLMRLAVNVSESLFIFFIGFWGMSKQEIHFEQVLIKASRKYDNSTLSQSDAETLVVKLRKLMKSEEVFLDNEISLVSLSKILKITPHHLSQVLNEQLGQNFYDFINSARIERAKEMLLNAGFQKLPIIDIAYQVGFNNKTSFNNAFKKYTQVTPTQYKAKASI
jgi:AraC-like DNA-binding protein